MSWKKLASRIVFDNPWLTVLDDHVVNPRGGNHRYGWVHFKNRTVAIVPVDDERHTWLVGQQRYTLGKYSWEVPMGGAPVDDDPETSARRELEEETGLSAGRLTRIMKAYPSNSVTDEVAYIFLATGLCQGDARPEEAEDLDVKRLPLADAVAMVHDGAITDAISCLALLRIAAMDDIAASGRGGG